jgi:hypothetical protein
VAEIRATVSVAEIRATICVAEIRATVGRAEIRATVDGAEIRATVYVKEHNYVREGTRGKGVYKEQLYLPLMTEETWSGSSGSSG